ncbi:MAG TPA: zinc metalloprotease [Flavobacteriia bacterium]|nr:zinc metalloprotease [Flavobacteriia bacterium]
MKKVLFSLFAVAIILHSCQNKQDEVQDNSINMDDFYLYTDLSNDGTSDFDSRSADHGKNCFAMNVLNRQLNENPGLYNKMWKVEKHTREFINAKKPNNPGGGNGGSGGSDGGSGGTTPDNLGLINIPVYVHVVYSNSNENISDAQINSQITVLNNDFRRTNADANNTPTEFAAVADDMEIEFTLAGVYRHSNATSSWGTNDAVKAAYPPITPETHLNIWVCNIGGGILGYAQFPGGSPSTDGVVIGPNFFGNQGYVSAPFNEGRTATHEVGHYLNLRHIWGDGRCNRDDYVSDTPTSDRSNYGCPSYPTTHCRSTDMTMNYMDYTDDACMNTFTTGQKLRMRAIFSTGGARESMIN